jgi:hypothetical protein
MAVPVCPLVDLRLCYLTRGVDDFTDSLRKNAFSSALAWLEEGGGSKVIGSSANRVVRLFSRTFA